MITNFASLDSAHIGIPEGALDVKRALAERAIFSRPKAGFPAFSAREVWNGRAERDLTS
jgi:hypothetical protein